MFIAVFSRAQHWTVSWFSWTSSIPSIFKTPSHRQAGDRGRGNIAPTHFWPRH
jgi:hypothetical protein